MSKTNFEIKFEELENLTEDFVQLEMSNEEIKKYYKHLAAVVDSLKQIIPEKSR